MDFIKDQYSILIGLTVLRKFTMFLDQPAMGMVKILPLFSTFCIVISALLVAIGWFFILKGRRSIHQKIMIYAAIFAVLFLIIYIWRTLLIGNTSFGGPDHIKPYYVMFLLFHIFLAITGLVFGAVTITYAFKGRFIKHKKIGPQAAIIWFCSATTGVLVYLALYVFWDPGRTTSMIKAILGA